MPYKLKRGRGKELKNVKAAHLDRLGKVSAHQGIDYEVTVAGGGTWDIGLSGSGQFGSNEVVHFSRQAYLLLSLRYRRFSVLVGSVAWATVDLAWLKFSLQLLQISGCGNRQLSRVSSGVVLRAGLRGTVHGMDMSMNMVPGNRQGLEPFSMSTV